MIQSMAMSAYSVVQKLNGVWVYVHVIVSEKVRKWGPEQLKGSNNNKKKPGDVDVMGF